MVSIAPPPKPALIPRNTVAGPTVMRNKGLEMAYRKKLKQLVLDMDKSVQYWLEAEYKKNLPKIKAYDAALPAWKRVVHRLIPAMDASPARSMEYALRRRMLQWKREFDAKAKSISRWFVNNADKGTTAATGASIAKTAGFTVQFQNTLATNNVLQSLIIENVSLISSIPAKYFDEVQGLVMRSVRAGRDVGYLKEELQKRYDITERRAVIIARDQNNKATEAIGRTRMQDLGITQAVWIHSGGGKTPRPSHVEANGKVYELAEGCLIGGRYIHPGEEINCRCSKRPIIPYFAQSQRDLARAGEKADA